MTDKTATGERQPSSQTPGAERRPVFLVGADRSGTTLLRLVVNAHSEFASPAETWFLIDLIEMFPNGIEPDRQDEAISHVTGLRRWKNFAVDPARLAEPLRNRRVSVAEFFDHFMTLEIEGSGKERWVDKTPEYVLHVEAIARIFPTAQFVAISRDGRDVFHSLQPRRWRGRTARRIGRYWARCIDSSVAASRALPADRWLWIRYEDLVRDLPGTAHRLCEFLEVPYQAEMTSFHESARDAITEQARQRGFHDKLMRPPSPDDVFKWKQSRSPFSEWMFEAVTAPQLAAADYEVRLAAPLAWLLRGVAFVEDFIHHGWVRMGKELRRLRAGEAS